VLEKGMNGRSEFGIYGGRGGRGRGRIETETKMVIDKKQTIRRIV
jgi:hypothetical protein